MPGGTTANRLFEARLIEYPPGRAGEVRLTVPIRLPPPIAEFVLRVIPASAGGAGT